jgi:hypothetical protein
MSRGAFGVVSLLSALALGGMLFAMNANNSGPSSATAQRVETQAQQVAATANFGQAAIQLQTFYAENGTYVGAVLPPSYGVTLVRADATSYCVQMESGTAVQHLVGPGGQPAAGGC